MRFATSPASTPMVMGLRTGIVTLWSQELCTPREWECTTSNRVRPMGCSSADWISRMGATQLVSFIT